MNAGHQIDSIPEVGAALGWTVLDLWNRHLSGVAVGQCIRL